MKIRNLVLIFIIIIFASSCEKDEIYIVGGGGGYGSPYGNCLICGTYDGIMSYDYSRIYNGTPVISQSNNDALRMFIYATPDSTQYDVSITHAGAFLIGTWINIEGTLTGQQLSFVNQNIYPATGAEWLANGSIVFDNNFSQVTGDFIYSGYQTGTMSFVAIK